MIQEHIQQQPNPLSLTNFWEVSALHTHQMRMRMVIGDTKKTTKSSFINQLLGGICVAHVAHSLQEENDDEEDGDGDPKNTTNSLFTTKLVGDICGKTTSSRKWRRMKQMT